MEWRMGVEDGGGAQGQGGYRDPVTMVMAMGPLSGGQKLRICGIGFYNAPHISIKFVYQSGSFEVVPGTFVSECELKCESPNFEAHKTT